MSCSLLTTDILGMPIIDRFQEDRDVFIFLISTMAGGTGLNLTAANKVVIFGERFALTIIPPLIDIDARSQLE